MDEIDIAAAKRKRDDREIEENDDIAAQIEDDPKLRARKVELEKRKIELYKVGFRFFEDPELDRKFILKSSEECELERLRQLDRIRSYEADVASIDDLVFPDPLPDYLDGLFAQVWGKPLPQARLDHIKIFDKITTKNDGEYRKQHWHMKEVEMEEEEEEEESAEVEMEEESAEVEVEEEVAVEPLLRVDALTFRFHPQLWRIHLHGEFTNTLPNTLQICSLKLTSPDDSDYPLKVYGDLTLGYTNGLWHQVFFSRDSDHCQTLTKEDPYLLLTGPYWNPLAPPKTEVYIQADLKLKGTTQSDADKFLCLSAKCQEKDVVCSHEFTEYDLDIDPHDPYMCHVSSCCEKKPCECREFGKHYLLEMTRTIVTNSVFAIISVRLFRREPTDRLLSCFFTAYSDESSRKEDMKVVLLDCRDGKEEPVLEPVLEEKEKEEPVLEEREKEEPVLEEREKEEPVLENKKGKEKEYTFELSRQTICVDWRRMLIVYIEHDKTGKELIFKPKLKGDDAQDVIIDPGGSRIQVKVEWSIYWEKYDRLLY